MASFQAKTVHIALEIVGALGHTSAASVSGRDVLRRIEPVGLRDFNEIYPILTTQPGALLRGDGGHSLQLIWEGKNAHDHLMWERT